VWVGLVGETLRDRGAVFVESPVRAGLAVRVRRPRGPMSIEFQLLGDIEVWIAGSAVEVGHAWQRCVLAAPAIEVNRRFPPSGLRDRPT
jgi:hypothetical protein